MVPSPAETCIVAAALPVDAGVEGRRRMREADLPARERERDLAVVHVSGEDEVEAARLELLEHPRVVAEQDREVGLAREPVRVEPGRPAHDQLRVGSRDPDAPAPQLEQPAVVAEQRGRLELAAGRSGEPAGRG